MLCGFSSENGKPLYSPQEEGAFQQILQPQGSKSFTNKGGTFACYADYDYNGSYEDAFGVTDSRLLPESASFWCRVYFYHKQEGQICVRQPRVWSGGRYARSLHPECFWSKMTKHWGDFWWARFCHLCLNSNNYVLATSSYPNTVNFNGSEDRVMLYYANGFPRRRYAVAPCLGNLQTHLAAPSQTTWVKTYICQKSPWQGVGFIWNPLWSIRKSQWLHRGLQCLGPAPQHRQPATGTNLNGQMVTINDRQPLLPGKFRAYTLIRLSWQKPTMWFLCRSLSILPAFQQW